MNIFHRTKHSTLGLTIISAYFISASLFSAPLFAKDKEVDPEVVINMLSNIQSLQKQNSELLGRIESLEYQVEQLKKAPTSKANIDNSTPNNLNPSTPIPEAPKSEKPEENKVLATPKTTNKAPNPSNSPALEAKDKVDLLNSADNLYKMKAFSAAKEAYQTFLTNFSSDDKALHALINLGYSQKALNEIDAAIDTFNKVLAHEKTDTALLPELLLVTAQLYDANNASSSADLLYNNLLTNFPSSKEANIAKQAQQNRNK